MMIFSIFKEISEAGVEEENYFFRSTEAIFVGWFTLEFLIRFVVSPSKVDHFIHFITKLKFSVLVRIYSLIFKYNRPPWDPPVLCLTDPQPAVLTILSGVHRQGCPNIQNSQDPQDFQAVETHHWSEDPGDHTEEQPQVTWCDNWPC